MKSPAPSPQDKAQESLERFGRESAISLHRKEATRLRGKAAECHPAAGGHTNSAYRYTEMAEFHDAVVQHLETMPTQTA